MPEDKPEKTPQEIEKKKAALVKAKSAGFAQGKHISPVVKTTTERIDEAFQGDDLDRFVRKIKKAYERGLDSDNTKIAVDTAHKLMTVLHRPATNVNINNEGGGDTVFNINVDNLDPEDLALFNRAKAAKDDVIDVEVVEDEDGPSH